MEKLIYHFKVLRDSGVTYPNRSEIDSLHLRFMTSRKEAMEPRILILVLAVDKEPWSSIEIEGQNLTWKMSPPPNIEIFRYVGSKNFHGLSGVKNAFWESIQWMSRTISLRNLLVPKWFLDRALIRTKLRLTHLDRSNGVIRTSVPEGFSTIGLKTLEVLQFAFENFDFEFIYRTNVSSYLDLPKLNSFISQQSRREFYGGFIGSSGKTQFASGSGYFLSRDLVSKVLQNRNLWDHREFDDVALGKLISNFRDVGIQRIERVDLRSISDVQELSPQGSGGVFHYRCKMKNPLDSIAMMEKLDVVLHS